MQKNQCPQRSKDTISQEYTINYQYVGRQLLDLPVVEEMFEIISQLLPNNYKGVDLGCNQHKDAKYIQQLCKKQGKEGIFLGVDPYSKVEGVISMTSEQFVSQHPQANFDAIMGKYSLHLNVNQQQFFKNAHYKLKDSGHIFILALSRQCKLPWTKALQNTFTNPYVNYQETIPKELFQWDVIKRTYNFEIDKKAFIQIVRRRAWTTLLKNTQQQIDECVALLQSKKEQVLPVVMHPQIYVVRKRSQK